jgi:hypothetical protein
VVSATLRRHATAARDSFEVSDSPAHAWHVYRYSMCIHLLRAFIALGVPCLNRVRTFRHLGWHLNRAGAPGTLVVHAGAFPSALIAHGSCIFCPSKFMRLYRARIMHVVPVRWYAPSSRSEVPRLKRAVTSVAYPYWYAILLNYDGPCYSRLPVSSGIREPSSRGLVS